MIVEKVRQEIKKYDKPEYKINIQRFFKERLANPYALKGSVFKEICESCFEEVKDNTPRKILIVCDQLIQTNERYPRGIGVVWASSLKGQYTKANFKLFESWLKGVTNWGACDTLCCGPLGHIVDQFPALAKSTQKWTKSKNRWYRRAAAVSLINAVRNQKLLNEVLKTATLLLTDKDDMVQKGYGWMLKEASNEYPDEVFDFVMKNKQKMPRTALRYAIEKLPPEKRAEAMAK